MKNSIWEVKGQSFSYPTLVNDIETDVAIIGGGITGISCAQLLSTCRCDKGTLW